MKRVASAGKMLFRAAVVLLSLTIGSAGGASVAEEPAGDTPVIDIGSRRELMTDDFLIAHMQGSVARRLHAPTPREEVLRFDKPWEGNTSSYVQVFWDAGLYRMFYRGWNYIIGEKLSQDHSAVICYAESEDGIHWTRPDLGLRPFKSEKETNIVELPGKIGSFSTVPSTFTVSIDENPACPADARYKGLILAIGPDKKRGLIPLQSADGRKWRAVTEQQVIVGDAFDSPNRVFWDPVRGEYRAYYRTIVGGHTEGATGNGGRRDIKTAVSPDLVRWTEGQLLNYPGAADEQIYTNMIYPYPRAPHLLVGFPTRYLDRGWSDSMRELPDLKHRQLRGKANARVGTALTDTLFMSSRDGITFRRFSEAFIRPGPERPGTWNYGHTFVSCPAVTTKSSLPGAPDELSMYCTEHYWTGESGSALRRYTLRMDGFASLSAKADGGEILTKPLRFEGKRLRLNFSTSVAGSIQVEIQDLDGRPLPGFRLEDCSKLFGDSLDRAATWKAGGNVDALAGRPVRLRFVMKDADLFAFQFAD